MTRLRGALAGPGARPFTIAAVVLLVAGVLAILVEVQSPSSVLWTGRAVRGVEQGGIVFYSLGGQRYTLDGPDEQAPGETRHVTVYVDGNDPASARLDGPARWLDATMVLVWFVAAGGCLAVGQWRRRRARRRVQAGGFGAGFDPAEIHAALWRREQQR